MIRGNRILLGVLIAQIALMYVVRHVGTNAENVPPETSFLAGFDGKTVSRIEIYHDDKLGIALARVADQWVIENHQNYPANPDKVDELLTALGNLKTRGPVASGADRLEQMGVSEKEYERKLVVKQGDKTTTLFVGYPAGGRRTSVRLAGSDDVHAVGSLSDTTAPPTVKPWVEAAYAQIDYDDIEMMTVENAQGTFVFEKGQPWKASFNGAPIRPPAGKVADLEKIPGLVRRMTSIQLREPVAARPSERMTRVSLRLKKAGEPPADDAATATSTPSEERNFEIARISKEEIYVKESGRPAVMLDEADVAELIDLKPADLAKDPPPPPPKD